MFSNNITKREIYQDIISDLKRLNYNAEDPAEYIKLLQANEEAQKRAKLGQDLRYLRLIGGRTQKELGFILGTCKQHVYKWEKGLFKPTVRHLMDIIKWSNVSDPESVFNELIQEYYL